MHYTKQYRVETTAFVTNICDRLVGFVRTVLKIKFKWAELRVLTIENSEVNPAGILITTETL